MSLTQPEAWGPLRGRYEARRPRRMLALDGGGIRGVITLRVLAELESKLRAHYGTGDHFRLSDFFDYVGGTSTGAIIAAALARGLSVSEIESFYETFGREIFRKRRWGIWESLYGDGALARKLKEVYGSGSTLRPTDLKTLLLVVTRNATTDSVWPVSSNPAAKYNDTDRADCNLQIPLWKLVRASTAAPVYFPAEVIEWAPGDPEKAFVFVDGGTTAYNNPAFLMVRLATSPAYRLGWETGEGNLLVISAGTGSSPVEGVKAEDPDSNLVSAAATTLSALMSQAAFDQDINCRTVGRCVHGPPLDREVGDLIPRDGSGRKIPLSEDLGRSFLYARYDAAINEKGLKEMGLGDIDARKVGKLDAIDSMPELTRIGEKIAEGIDLDDFRPFVDMDL